MGQARGLSERFALRLWETTVRRCGMRMQNGLDANSIVGGIRGKGTYEGGTHGSRAGKKPVADWKNELQNHKAERR